MPADVARTQGQGKLRKTTTNPACPLLCCSMTLASYPPYAKGGDVHETDRSCLTRKLSAFYWPKDERDPSLQSKSRAESRGDGIPDAQMYSCRNRKKVPPRTRERERNSPRTSILHSGASPVQGPALSTLQLWNVGSVTYPFWAPAALL